MSKTSDFLYNIFSLFFIIMSKGRVSFVTSCNGLFHCIEYTKLLSCRLFIEFFIISSVGIFLFREDAQTPGKCTELKKIWIASVNTAKKNRT